MSILIERKYDKLFKFWLISLIFLLILMIVVGGLTRLTDSGLSITKWDLFVGILPPLNQDEWEHFFSLYKKIPQYYLMNQDMTLNDFKVIYLWEYIHRLLGRFIGLFFLLPLIYFTIKKTISKRYNIQLFVIFFLILIQGFVGWYMVESGLVHDVTVSHYRLSLHLSIAFIILSSLIWIYINYSRKEDKLFFINKSSLPLIKIFIILIFLQISFGALVSGLDAGKIYQTWPLMNNSYFPDNIELLNFISFFNFDDQGLIQFFHRNIAYLILIVNLLIGLFVFKHQIKKLYKPYFFSFLIILLQIILGILTLLSNVNIGVASLHQISSIFLLILSLNLYHKSIV